MKFVTTPVFDNDYRRLKAEHKVTFERVVREKFVPACDVFSANSADSWPKSLRVKSVRSAHGIFEMTWSFASPDGRATFEFITFDNELAVLWRRVGDHEVFNEP